jgi:hypothetical protein
VPDRGEHAGVGGRDTQSLQHQRMRQVDPERAVGTGGCQPAPRCAPVTPAQPGGQQPPGEREGLHDEHRLEHGAGHRRLLMPGQQLHAVGAHRGARPGRRCQQGRPGMPAGEPGQRVEMPGGEPAADHVQHVARQPLGRVPQPRPDRARCRQVVVDRDGERHLVAQGGDQDGPVMAFGAAQQPAQQREGQVHLHRDQQEVQVIARVPGLQVAGERPQRAGPRVQPRAVGREVDETPRHVRRHDQQVAPPPERQPANLGPPPVVVNQHERREQEEQLPAGVEDGDERPEDRRDRTGHDREHVHAHHEPDDQQPDQVKRDHARAFDLVRLIHRQRLLPHY